MQHLLGMNVREGAADLVNYGIAECRSRVFEGYDALQRAAVYPLHLYAIAKALHVLESIILANVWMIEAVANLELFA